MLTKPRTEEKKMKSLRKWMTLSLAIAGLLLAGTAAKADTLTLSLAAPYQIGAATVFTFDGTITNNGTTTEYLNGDSLTVAAPLLSDDSPFFLSPVSLAAGNSWTGELFTITIPWGTDLGLYAGAFQIIGGADGSAQDVLASEDFNVQVTPEPSSFLLLGTGLLALGVLTGRKLLA